MKSNKIKVGNIPTFSELGLELQEIIGKFDKLYQVNSDIIDCDPKAPSELYSEQEAIENIMVTLEVFRKKQG